MPKPEVTPGSDRTAAAPDAHGTLARNPTRQERTLSAQRGSPTADRLHAVLVGAGHTHLHVLDQAPHLRAAGVELTLVAPASFVYSGMATAVAAGERRLEEASIDVGALARRRGVHHHVTRVRAVDPTRRRLTLEDGADLAYDVASLNLGSVARTDRMEVAAEVATVKPFDRLLGMARWLAELPSGAGARVSIVGGGPTGLELAGQFSHRFGDRLEVAVLERGPTPGAGLPAGAQGWLARLLRARGVEVRTDAHVTAVQPDHLVVDGTRREHDAAVIATGLAAPPLATEPGLGEVQGIPVTAELHHRDHPTLYAVGDCARFLPRPLPRIGVHGVRQGPVLVDSLEARAAGRPLPRYQPQRRALQILDVGGGTALATRGRLWCTGPAALWLKHRIDQRWLDRYRDSDSDSGSGSGSGSTGQGPTPWR